MLKRRTALALPPALLAAPAGLAQANWQASQPIRLIIPFTPGSTLEPVARLCQPHLQAELGQPVVIEHRPGGATVVGTQEMARSAPDGHTLLMIANSFAANVTLRPNTPYNGLRDFAPTALTSVVPHVLAVHPSVARDFPAFVEAARRPRAGFAFGSYGIGTSNHLGAEQFVRLAGFEATHVPYNGTAQSHADLVGGRLQFMFANLPEMIQAAQNNQVRAVAISNEARVRELPDAPTMAELGFPLVLSDSWFGVIARADVAPHIRAAHERAWLGALGRPEIRGRLEELGYTVLARGAEPFGAWIRRYAETYAGVIREANIRVE
jgi:tripartite-type tricarboxylate transporter receptor subunit TctC